MQKLFLVLITLFITIACSNSDSEEQEQNEILIGNFTEVTPVNERISLEFLSETELRQEILGHDRIPTFTIRLLNNNNLELSCNECDEIEPQIVSYRVIDTDTFEIGGFWPAETDELIVFQRD